MWLNFDESGPRTGTQTMNPDENVAEVSIPEPDQLFGGTPEIPGVAADRQAGLSIDVWCARDPDEEEEDDDFDYFDDEEDDEEDELDDEEEFDEEEFDEEEEEEEESEEDDF